MKIQDLPPIFLADLQHKVFPTYYKKSLRVVKLQCIKPTKQLGLGSLYYGYEDIASNNWYYDSTGGYPVYKIFLPILGARKYDPKRFKILDKLTVYKTDFK